MLIYEVVYSDGSKARVPANSVSDALAEAEYQFGGQAVDATIYDPVEHWREYVELSRT